MMVRIDAHQHLWRLAARGNAWPPPALAAIRRDIDAAELAPLLARHGIAGSIAVQSLPGEDDTVFLLEQARQHAFILGVVGWVDLAAPSAAQRISMLAADRNLVGLRPMLPDLPDSWLDQPALTPAVAAMLAHGLRFDALVQPRHLPVLLDFARRHPALPIVIDHAAKPFIAQGLRDPWRTDLARLAELPQVYCKLSGLVTEAGAAWRLAQLRPYVDHVLDVFGPHRVIWGSDWPVVNLDANYGAWLALSEALLDHLDCDQRAAIFGNNALHFYKIDRRMIAAHVFATDNHHKETI
jgi:L-fuconolactonase